MKSVHFIKPEIICTFDFRNFDIYHKMNNNQTEKFISENIQSDLNKLMLMKRSDASIDYDFAFRQIAGLQRIRYKIPLFYDTDNILFPPQLNIEQSSSQSTALYKSTLCEGNTFIDITAGFGVDFFFISGKFENAIYVDRNEELCKIAEHNFRSLGATNVVVNIDDAVDFIHKMPVSDCVLIDPARRDKHGGKTVFLVDCEPNISKIYQKILEKTNLLMIKLSPMLDITAAINALTNVFEVHIVSVENECKEVLLLLKPEIHTTIKFVAINILKNNSAEKFEFSKESEFMAICNYSSIIENYLYEPNSSVLKAGAFKSIANAFNLNKLNKNTHLYTSEKAILDFPGRSFKVVKVWPFNKKELQNLKNQIPKANISTRNFPLKPEELKKKIGIADGGDTYLFGCTLANESKVIIQCEKVTSTI